VDAGKWQYGNNRPFIVLNNGVFTDRFCYNADERIFIRKKLGLSEQEILIGNVGHFWGEVKNQSFVVTVFNELYKKDKRYRLCLIGDGSFQTIIKEQVENLGLKTIVFFTGNIDNVNEYLNAFDLILMPSLYEGLPLTLIEQQANGLQCVCSDVITKEVDKTGNILFVSLKQTAADWAEEISRFIKLENRKIRSKNAVEKIKNAGYSIKEEAWKLFCFYKSIAK
jgi:glycosyltransferase involved in cell wall biosynthesis